MLSQKIKDIHLIEYTLGDEILNILVDICFSIKKPTKNLL